MLAVVDAGPLWSAGRVVDYIRSIGRKPEDLGLILMTHSHPDHSGGATPLIERTGAQLLAHSGDTMTSSDHEVRLSFSDIVDGLTGRLPFLSGIPVGETVNEGQLLAAKLGIRVIHTPGHTPGSVCYLLEDRAVLFTGDTIFSNGERLSRSVPFPRYNGHDYRRSLSRLATMEFDTLCGGHGSPLVGDASAKLRSLLAAHPDPPTWGSFIRSIPGRLAQFKGLSGDGH